MAERHGRSTGPAGLLRTGLEAGSGLIAVHAVAILLSGKGMHPYPAAWAGALTGLALWLVIARHGTPRAARRGGTLLLWLGVAVVLLAIFGMITGSIGFGSILAFAVSLWAFGLAATSLSALFDTIDEGRDGAALQSVGQGLVGCYSGGIGLQSGHDRAPVLAVAMPHGNAAVVEHDHPGSVLPEPDLAPERSRAVPGPDQLDIERLPGNWLEGSGALTESAAARAARRAFDIAAAGGLLLLTLPVMLLTAIAVRLESRGPILYRQERVGQDGRVFTLFKFRSMTVDAEAHGSPVWAVPQDPRVTRVGRFTRLTRIDELPQVLNVLRGDMAFIGPRPERPHFVAQLERVIPHYADRAVVKPGITGWAQVRYRYGASVEDARMKLGYDLYYIRHRSLALDMRIIAATVRVVVLQEGAR